MVINPLVGVYIPIIRIPIKGGMTIPNIATLDHGTFDEVIGSLGKHHFINFSFLLQTGDLLDKRILKGKRESGWNRPF